MTELCPAYTELLYQVESYKSLLNTLVLEGSGVDKVEWSCMCSTLSYTPSPRNYTSSLNGQVFPKLGSFAKNDKFGF